MIVSTFVEKYNKSSTAIAVEESHIVSNGAYEAELEHDNVDEDTLEVYSGATHTGSRLAYTLTAPSDASWKRIIHVETDQPTIYISYETTGDQVEADDVNRLQEAVVNTQEAVNVLTEQVTGGSGAYTWNQLMGVGKTTGLTITSQPQSVSVTAGETATFYVGAGSTEEDVLYEWQYQESGSAIWNVADTTATIKIENTTTEMNGRRYRCVVTDTAGGSIVSGIATLYVAS